jgi:hypothetical protein
MDVTRRNELWQARKDRWIHDQQCEKYLKETEECTFAPKRFAKTYSSQSKSKSMKNNLIKGRIEDER